MYHCEAATGRGRTAPRGGSSELAGSAAQRGCGDGCVCLPPAPPRCPSEAGLRGALTSQEGSLSLRPVAPGFGVGGGGAKATEPGRCRGREDSGGLGPRSCLRPARPRVSGDGPLLTELSPSARAGGGGAPRWHLRLKAGLPSYQGKPQGRSADGAFPAAGGGSAAGRAQPGACCSPGGKSCGL